MSLSVQSSGVKWYTKTMETTYLVIYLTPKGRQVERLVTSSKLSTVVQKLQASGAKSIKVL
jgi:hypothetical protein